MAAVRMREAAPAPVHAVPDDDETRRRDAKVAAADAAWRSYLARAAANANASATTTPTATTTTITDAEARAIAAVGGAALAAEQELAEAERELRGRHVPQFWARLSAVEASLASRAQQRERRQQQPSTTTTTIVDDEESMLVQALEDLAGAVLAQRARVAALAQRLLVATAAEAWEGDDRTAAAATTKPSFLPWWAQTRGTSDDTTKADTDTDTDTDDSTLEESTLPPELAAQVAAVAALPSRHAALCGALLAAGAPVSLASLLRRYYTAKVRELARAMAEFEEEEEEADDEEEEGEGDDQHRICHPGRAAARALAALGPRWPEGPRRCARALGCLGAAGGGSDGGQNGNTSTHHQRQHQSAVRALHEEACASAARLHVAEAVAARASGSFESRALPGARRMALRGAPFELLRLVLLAEAEGAALASAAAADAPNDHLVAPRLREWRLRLSYLALETLGALRTREFFDAVVDYPSSRPAVLDAAACLAHTSLAPAFAGAVRSQLRSRLLHAGALTPDVLHTYVAAIRALAEVDPTGGLAKSVVAPVRAHLRRRPDAVRCVVSLLTGDGAGVGGGGGGGGGAGVEGDGGSSMPLLLEELLRQEQEEDDEEEEGQGGQATAARRQGGGAVSGPALTPQEAREAWPTTEADGDQLALQLLLAQQQQEEDGDDDEEEVEEDEQEDDDATAARRPPPLGPTAARRTAPPPPLAAPAPRRPPRVDVVPMLIAIYGSPALFLAEYRAMLGARLLAPPASRPGDLGPRPQTAAAAPTTTAPTPKIMAGGSVYDTTRELRTLELLKMRFGEGALRSADVMLRDLADSRRVNLGVHALGGEALLAAEAARRERAAAAAEGGGRGSGGGGAGEEGEEGDDGLGGKEEEAAREGDDASASAATTAAASPPFLPKLDATIASRLYWPSLPSAQQRPLALPPAVKAAMRAYARRFSHLKAPRRLKWRPALGLVELEVQPAGPDSPPLTFRVTPPHAALLLALDESGAPDAGDGRPPLPPGPVAASLLAERLGVPSAVVRQKALFWVNAGVLTERRDGGEVVYERVRGAAGTTTATATAAGAAAASDAPATNTTTATDATALSPYEATDLTWADPGAGGPGGGAAGGGGAEARLRAEVGPFEGYVIGLLTNMGGGQGLSLDRLHGLLRIFCVGEPRYEGRVTQEQLGAYLGLMAAKGAVVAERGGVYRRPGAGQGGGGGGGGGAGGGGGGGGGAR